MGFKKFIKSVQESLGIYEMEKTSKKKSIKKVLKKLNAKKLETDELLKVATDKKKRKALEEEMQIIVCQIKSGNKILHKLSAT